MSGRHGQASSLTFHTASLGLIDVGGQTAPAENLRVLARAIMNSQLTAHTQKPAISGRRILRVLLLIPLLVSGLSDTFSERLLRRVKAG